MAWMMTQCIALLVTAPILHVRAAAGPAEQLKVRPAAVAGAFYPADPKELSTMIDDMLAKATPGPVDGEILAAVSPHAGYPYSGPVAAWTYAALKGHKYARVVVIAPSHYVGFGFTSVYDGDAYTTPLGTIPVDKEFARRLAKMNSTIELSDKGHQATADAPEHSVEVELPWLQTVLGHFELVPIVMGDQSYESSRALGVALAKMLRNEHDTLVLASSDLSHYHTYDQAETIDHKTLHALEAWDYLSMSRNFATQVWEACGGYPIIAAMIASERLGASHAVVLNYANSGDTAGDKSRVVGYGAVAFVKNPARGGAQEPPFALTLREKDELLRLARKSVETAVHEHKLYDAAAPAAEALNQERGAFVTLKEHGELRGCIGYITPMKSLAETVRDVAAYAALEDSRFKPVTAQELPLLEYEISVMSPLRRVLDIKEIKVGKHGLIMKQGDIEGILLPQVPVEEHWNRDTFIQETCLKAGLPRQAWKDDDTDIFMFTALVFGVHLPAETTLPERPTDRSQTPQPSKLGPDSPQP